MSEPFNINQPTHRIARDVVKRIEQRNGNVIAFGPETYRDIEMLIRQIRSEIADEDVAYSRRFEG